jgi:hypothetical protein
MARRVGRCTLQSSRRSRRHTWPGLEADTDEPLDHHRDAAQCPQLGVEPEHLRAKPQGLLDGAQLGPGQPRGAAYPPSAAQGRLAAMVPLPIPHARGLT